MKAETIGLLARAPAPKLQAEQKHLARSVWLDRLAAQQASESLALAQEINEELAHGRKLAYRLEPPCPSGSLNPKPSQESLQTLADQEIDFRHAPPGSGDFLDLLHFTTTKKV
jgi:hypothetical protein